MILVLVNARLKTRATLLHPGRRLTTVCFDQTLNVANALAFGNHPRLSENSGGQLRNCRCPPSKSLIHLSHTSVAPESPDCRMILVQNNYYESPRRKEYIKSEREKSPPQRGVGGVGRLGETPSSALPAPSPISTSHPYFWAPFILVEDGK